MTDNADQAAKQQQEAAKKHAEETRKKLKEEREARAKASKEAPSDIKPTPTQEECDLAASGVYLSEHEEDGSTDPTLPQTKQAEAAKPKAGYQTRASTAS